MNSPSTEPPASVLDWDSGFWGVAIGRTTPASVSGDQDKLRRWTHANRVQCLYLRCLDGDPQVIEAARRFGFRLLESRVEYAKTMSGPPAPPDQRVRPVHGSDVEALSRIARTAHRDSRFYADPNLPDARCDDLFAAWIVNSCCHGFADWVLVADIDGQPQGYVTGQLDDGGAGRIGLIAVSETFRGRGLGRALLDGAAERFSRDGAATILVATQARNRPAVGLYSRHGFVQRVLSHDLHWWSDAAPARQRSPL
jgi:ribosomal protein S18 acetylase RimI-like enzyme